MIQRTARSTHLGTSFPRQKWFTRLAVASAIIETLGELDLAFPDVDQAKRRNWTPSAPRSWPERLAAGTTRHIFVAAPAGRAASLLFQQSVRSQFSQDETIKFGAAAHLSRGQAPAPPQNRCNAQARAIPSLSQNSTLSSRTITGSRRPPQTESSQISILWNLATEIRRGCELEYCKLCCSNHLRQFSG